MIYSANKAFIAILLLCKIQFTIGKDYSVKQTFLTCIIGLITILSLAVLMGIIHWAPYWHWNTYNWIFDVLILTIIGEEVFFRYYIQGYLLSRLKISPNSIVALSALLFGIAHIGGGFEYFALASIAGVFYAYIYQKTNQILWPIALHFLVNFVHFLLFTYPNSLQV